MILIPGIQMPKTCQDCPCFNVVTASDERGERYVGQLCRAKNLTILVKLDDGQFDDKWYNTVPPDFCPLVDVDDFQMTLTFKGENNGENPATSVLPLRW